MNITETPIDGLLVIEPKIWQDDRGYFYESYSTKVFESANVNAVFVQDNQSLSQKGTLRGLHAQAPPFAQGKLVRVIQGGVLDVVVDIRTKSATYGQHFAVELTGDNHKQLWIPPGFLHGFLTLQNDTIFTYKVTNYYDKNSEIGAMYNDPAFNINWAEHVAESNFLLSAKDLRFEDFSAFKSPF